MQRPHIFVTKEKSDGLRSLSELRQAIGSGHSRMLWERVLAAAENATRSDPFVPSSPLPHRAVENTAHANRDYTICKAAGDRILDSALAWLVTEDERFARSALIQIETLYDDSLWPDWRDQAHPTHPADLRTGQLGLDIGLAYDWLYDWLGADRRSFVVDGLIRRAFDPFWESVSRGAWWANGNNNWTTVIVGGLGMAAMAVGDDYARSCELVEYSQQRMLAYRNEYGPDGEFNESVAYASSTSYPVAYFLARLYETGGRENLVAEWPFPEACRWYMSLTIPPGQLAEFGDAHPGTPPAVSFVRAVAHATRDRVLQWCCLAHDAVTLRSRFAFDLLWSDDTLEPLAPDGLLPLGRAFPAHGGCVSSRSSWDPRDAACVVYAKAGAGKELHGHHDAGHVCIAGHGERLIVDMGSPRPCYPKDFFGPYRYEYPEASVRGHNVLMVGGREMRGTAEDRARIVRAEFDAARGGMWTMDTTALYDGVAAVRRTVVHLLPGIVAVADEAELEDASEISLRWHTAYPAEPDGAGRFEVRGGKAALSGRVVAVEGGPAAFRRGEHRYRPPFDRCRLGDPLHPPREGYVEACVRAMRCSILSLFAVRRAGAPAAEWEPAGNGWAIRTPEGVVRAAAGEGVLAVARDGAPGWRVPLGGA